MKNNLTCEIVEDLMPSYIDSLTSEVTNKAVREHLSQCEMCKAKLDNMKEPCSEDKIEHEKKEIDFLKKNRRKNIRTKLISLLAVVLVVAVADCTLPYLG
ncbi:MAG: zf-HC2 domain-containing protein, partial [Clostridia bacterium]|nr:zf-HC2 domain-containing protein [Clostridia bacterium]